MVTVSPKNTRTTGVHGKQRSALPWAWVPSSQVSCMGLTEIKTQSFFCPFTGGKYQRQLEKQVIHLHISELQLYAKHALETRLENATGLTLVFMELSHTNAHSSLGQVL